MLTKSVSSRTENEKMKICFALSSLFFLLAGHASARVGNTPTTDETKVVGKPVALLSPCTLYWKHVLLPKSTNGNGNGNEKRNKFLSCMLSDGTVYDVTGPATSSIHFDKVVSGQSILIAEGAKIIKNKIVVPADSKPKVANFKANGNNRRLTVPIGARSVLVLRVIASGTEPTKTKEQTSDDIFGTSGDLHNARSQIDKCSNGKMSFDPFNGNSNSGVSVSDGVYNVAITTGTSDDDAIRNAAISKATSLMGDLESQFDFLDG